MHHFINLGYTQEFVDHFKTSSCGLDANKEAKDIPGSDESHQSHQTDGSERRRKRSEQKIRHHVARTSRDNGKHSMPIPTENSTSPLENSDPYVFDPEQPFEKAAPFDPGKHQYESIIVHVCV